MIVRHAPSKRRFGLTLLELIVVLAILVALAAILVPMFPNLLRRTHKATDATQTNEVAKAVQLYQASYVSYPDEWDLMTTATGTVPDFLPADGAAVFGNAAGSTPRALTAAEVGHLSRVGIKNGHTFVATSPSHPTLSPYDAAVTAPVPLGTATVKAWVIETSTTSGEIPTEIKNILARDPSATFVVFGVGTRSTMVGKVMQNAPTSVPQNNDFTPANRYSRIGVIFQIAGIGVDESNSGVAGTKRARLICACALEDDELESTEKDIVNYYDIARTGQ